MLGIVNGYRYFSVFQSLIQNYYPILGICYILKYLLPYFSLPFVLDLKWIAYTCHDHYILFQLH